jgi:GAF domain-containing protein
MGTGAPTDRSDAVHPEAVRTDERELGGDLESVPAARRFVVGTLGAWGLVDLAGDAELVATELVTNAFLYAGPPVRVVLAELVGGGLRVEVHDSSRAVPVRSAGADGMTGRGMGLVDALSRGWGVSATDDGKAVWAELTWQSVHGLEPAEVDVDALLAAFDDELAGGTGRFTVRLGDVSTELLVAAKSHVDSVVRELTLAAGGADAGLTAEVPAPLAQLIEAVVTEFAEARGAIKRQAVAAARAGRPRTTLTLSLPLEAADAGERYLAALEEADSYARDARLLTLAAPAQHRAFRRWYVTSLVSALRYAAAGQSTVTQTPSFEQFLLQEIDHLDELQRTAARAARLQRVSASLAAAVGVEEVGSILLDDAIAELDADRGVLLSGGPPHLRVVAQHGYPAEVADRLAAASAETPLPAVDVLSAREPVWIEDADQRDARYPRLGELDPDSVATAVVSLMAGSRLVGALQVSFREARLFDEDERGFLVALGALAAQAMERAELYELQGRTADRLSRVQQVTAALARARNVSEVGDVVMEQASALLGAEVGALCLLAADGHTLELARVRAVDPDVARAWRSFDVEDELPAAEAVRTGQIVAVDSLAERDARWPRLAGTPPTYEHSLIALPLRVEHGALGALTLSFSSVRGMTQGDRDALTAMADVCAQALDRAHSAERVARGTARLSFLARASAELSSSLDVSQTLSDVVRLAVPELADWCVLHLVADGRLEPLAVTHADPAKVALAYEVQRRWPSRLTDDTGVGAVVRTGEPVLVPVVTEAMVTDAPRRDPEHTELLRHLGLSSAIIAPLVARGRTLGALTLVLAESGRHYDADDLTFASDLARRAALAIYNASLLERRDG